VQSAAVIIAGGIEPGLVIEVFDFHDEFITFPAAS
jgi:hypothetical protein